MTRRRNSNRQLLSEVCCVNTYRELDTGSVISCQGYRMWKHAGFWGVGRGLLTFLVQPSLPYQWQCHYRQPLSEGRADKGHCAPRGPEQCPFLLAEFTQLLFLATAGWRVGGLLSSEAPPTPPPLFTAESPCQPPLAGVTEFPVGGASSGAEEC